MKRIIPVIMALVFVSITAAAELVDSIAAKVDQEIVLVSEILDAVGDEPENIRKTSTSQAEYEQRIDRLMREALDEIIENKILYREALRASIVVGDDRVEKRISIFRDQFETTEEFMAYLNGVGVTLNSYRDRTRKQMMAQSMSGQKRRDLERAVVINEESVQEYFDTHQDEFSRPERIYLRQIMLLAPRNSPAREEAKATLASIREEIRGGADFNALAIRHSQAPGAQDGGIVGWNARGDLVEVLENAAFALDVGEVSGIVETQFGVQLLKVDQREAGGSVELSDVRGEIEPKLRRTDAAERYQKWMNDLRKRSNIRVYL